MILESLVDTGSETGANDILLTKMLEIGKHFQPFEPIEPIEPFEH